MKLVIVQYSGQLMLLRRAGEYQRSNQIPHIEEGQTTQWQQEKVLKDKQRSSKHYN
jgi:hypothetical protein